jgi:2-C-methyl-D-erythritol 4-phosphate cytidylyltransferase
VRSPAAPPSSNAGPVRVVMGSHRNLKVTRPDDLPTAEAIAAGEGGPPVA